MQFLTLDFQGKIFQTIVPVYFLDEIILTLKHIKTRSLFFLLDVNENQVY